MRRISWIRLGVEIGVIIAIMYYKVI